MKARMFWKSSVVVGLILLPVIGGCLQRASKSPRPSPLVATAQPALAPEPQPIVSQEEVSAEAPDYSDLSDAPVTVIWQDKPLPGDIHLSPPALKIVRMASAGAGEGVLLSFAKKSNTPFDLSADEIIYLNDIGMPATVITAMIERDQRLKQGGLDTAATAPESPGPDWIAPLGTAPPTEPRPLGSAYPEPFISGFEEPNGGVLASASPDEEMVEEVPIPPGEFYDALAPYGSWVDVAGYGQCWQPTVEVVNVSWKPYCDCGHWVYTECGWFWVSDYSWGWGPFHYGRWFHHVRLGWCWSPGSVWAPAWVCWRFNNQYCGWAPLPPPHHTQVASQTVHQPQGLHVAPLPVNAFHFIAWSHFHDHNLAHHGVPALHAASFFNHTTLVAGATKTGGRIVNSGVPADKVAAVTGVPVHKLEWREASVVAQNSTPGHREPTVSGIHQAHTTVQSALTQLKIVRPIEPRVTQAPLHATEPAATQTTGWREANHSSVASAAGGASGGTTTWELGPGGELVLRGSHTSQGAQWRDPQGSAFSRNPVNPHAADIGRGVHAPQEASQNSQSAWGHNQTEPERNQTQNSMAAHGRAAYDPNDPWQPTYAPRNHEPKTARTEAEIPHYSPPHETHQHFESAPVHESQHSSPAPESSHHSESSSSHSSSSSSSFSSSSSGSGHSR